MDPPCPISVRADIPMWTPRTLGVRAVRGLLVEKPHRELGKHPSTACWCLILQFRRCSDCPLLTVEDRCRPMVRARRGHGQRRAKVARTWLQRSQLMEITRLKRIYYLYSAIVRN
jgi:hypothetical protein